MSRPASQSSSAAALLSSIFALLITPSPSGARRLLRRQRRSTIQYANVRSSGARRSAERKSSIQRSSRASAGSRGVARRRRRADAEGALIAGLGSSASSVSWCTAARRWRSWRGSASRDWSASHRACPSATARGGARRTVRRGPRRARCGLIAEQLGQAPVKDAPSAQSPLLQRFLGAAPAADVIIRGARAVTTDRFEEPGVAQQPECLPALRAGALGRKRLVVAGAAHRSLGPVRHRAPVATAVRAPLRLHGRTSAAQHPALALAAARADLPAVRAGDGRAGPADRAQIRLTATMPAKRGVWSI